MKLIKSYWWLLLLMIVVITAAILFIPGDFRKTDDTGTASKGFEWNVPDTIRIPHNAEGDLIRYGRELIANTAFYLGPKGKIAAVSNGMNCQNCHLDAGTRIWGNNYGAVFSTYPKFRARSGSIESIYKRVNDCIERSLNGKAIDSNGHEMQAIYAYMKWLGKDVPEKTKPEGSGIYDLAFMDRPADPSGGKAVYMVKCKRCHGENGEGLKNEDDISYKYPPLWGDHSFTNGAGLFRISRLAGYVRYNMPFDLSTNKDAIPVTDEEAWDLAAFINSQPRPEKVFKQDWPDISTKPFDHPYGPYADNFTEQQHKFGPFGSIAKKK